MTILCYRCVKHAGQLLHWCIRLAFADGKPVICQCPCRGINPERVRGNKR